MVLRSEKKKNKGREKVKVIEKGQIIKNQGRHYMHPTVFAVFAIIAAFAFALIAAWIVDARCSIHARTISTFVNI